MPERRATRVRALTLGRLLMIVTGGPGAVTVIAVIVGFLIIGHQNSVRGELLDRIEPASAQARGLLTAMVNQETGIRGYELTGERSFLQPYELGRAQARSGIARLRDLDIRDTRVALDLAVTRIDSWQQDTALPAVRTGRTSRTSGFVDTTVQGKHEFDAVRAALSALQGTITVRVRAARHQLENASTETEVAFALIGVALLLSIALSAVFLRRFITAPVARLGQAVQRVAAGEIQQGVTTPGPRDIELLADSVEAMRRRLVDELDASQIIQRELAVTAADLQRSNAELEQFAYVASHDLQEPLRKVTSFCQLLESRYGDQLDDRGHQYIDFAVDGAKRMQQLVNDLLAFSRVGRSSSPPELTDLSTLVGAALADLAQVIELNDAEVTVGPLPTLTVAPALIRVVFQNLIANAIKFRGEAAPVVDVQAEQVDAEWRFSVADNGIGIEAEYAERIFIIFQRLHTREAYPGTGIGLAMCRKIVEHHGGTMWLDTTYQNGTRMQFTLPTTPPETTLGEETE